MKSFSDTEDVKRMKKIQKEGNLGEGKVLQKNRPVKGGKGECVAGEAQGESEKGETKKKQLRRNGDPKGHGGGGENLSNGKGGPQKKKG